MVAKQEQEITVKRKRNKFTQISNAVIVDPRIDNDAYRLWCYAHMVAGLDDWRIRPSVCAKFLGSHYRYEKAVKVLREVGLLIITPRRVKGRFCGYEWDPQDEFPSTISTSSPDPDYRDPVKPGPAIRGSINNTDIDKDLLKEKKNTSYSSAEKFSDQGKGPTAPDHPGRYKYPAAPEFDPGNQLKVAEGGSSPAAPSSRKDKIAEIAAAAHAKNKEAAAKKSTAKTKTPVGELLDHYLEAFLSKYPNCSMLPDTKGKVAGNAKALLERCHGDIATAKSLIIFWIENFESLKKGALSWAQDLEEPLLTKLYLFLDRIRPEYERAQAKKEDSNTENDYIIQPFTLRRPTND